MKTELLAHWGDPERLEALYRSDKSAFKLAFDELKSELPDDLRLSTWEARLHYEKPLFPSANKQEIRLVVVLAILAGILAKLPALTGLDEDRYYTRNLGFILIPALTAYFLYRTKAPARLMLLLAIATTLTWVYIHILPFQSESDTYILAILHHSLLLWGIAGIGFIGAFPHEPERRLDYLHYNGDLMVISTLIGLAGMILTGMTIGLFELIGLSIAEFYFENIVVFCLPAIPIVGSYLIQNNPLLVGKIAPLIARIFSPIALVMLIIYLFALLFTGKEDPYNDREFLLLFNFLLLGVMALIVFSLAENREAEKTRWEKRILLGLAVVTIVINGIALSAILFRIIHFGITPNRLAVMGSNALMLANLLWIAFRLLRNPAPFQHPGEPIARFLPIYLLWAAIVTFGFPWIF